MLNCSNWYCSRCGKHRASTAQESHNPDCPKLDEALRSEAFWSKAKKRREGTPDA